MELNEKLEILIKRSGYKKTDFAAALGITYRALANYISASRTPRGKIITRMAQLLEVPEELLTDKNRSIVLTGAEKLYFYGKSDKEVLSAADGIISEIEKLFDSDRLEDSDKTALYNCISEKYFASKMKK